MNNMCSVVADHAETQKEGCNLGLHEVEVGLVRECGQDNSEIEVVSMREVYEQAMDQDQVDVYP